MQLMAKSAFCTMKVPKAFLFGYGSPCRANFARPGLFLCAVNPGFFPQHPQENTEPCPENFRVSAAGAIVNSPETANIAARNAGLRRRTTSSLPIRAPRKSKRCAIEFAKQEVPLGSARTRAIPCSTCNSTWLQQTIVA